MKRKKRTAIKIVILILALSSIAYGLVNFNNIQTGYKDHVLEKAMFLRSANNQTQQEEGLFDHMVNSFYQYLYKLIKKDPLTLSVTLNGQEVGLSGLNIQVYDVKTDVLLQVIGGGKGQIQTEPVPLNRSYRITYQVPENMMSLSNKVEITFARGSGDIHIDLSTLTHIEEYHIDDQGYMVVDQVTIKVPLIMQKPDLPNGCEITAMAALLNYYKYTTTHVALSEGHLDKMDFYYLNGERYGPDPNEAFVGDPSESTGWYVFEKPIIKAAESFLRTQNSDTKVVDNSGSELDAIIDLVSKGYPQVVWTTLDHTEAKYGNGWFIENKEDKYTAIRNLHSVVVMGFDQTNVYLMDPLQGYTQVPIEMFKLSYDSLGKRALGLSQP